MKSWMVRPGNRGQREQHALNRGQAIIGWGEVGDLSDATDLPAIRRALRRAHPDISNALLGNWAGQLDRFVHQMDEGDIVAMPSKLRPGLLYLGRVVSEYCYDEEAADWLRQVRGVSWSDRPVERSSLSHDLRASLGSLLTVCEIGRNDAVKRLAAILDGEGDPGSASQGSKMAGSLDELAAAAPVDVGIRHLIGLMGVHRRTAGTVTQMVATLEALGLDTTSPLADGQIDDLIHVRRRDVADGELDPVEEAADGEPVVLVDYRVARIPSAVCEMESVAPDDSIVLAHTRMLENNFSQLPVLGEGGLAGVITWSSIAAASFQRSLTTVAQAMDVAPPVVSLRQHLLDIVDPVERHGYVFVHGDDVTQIEGIVTIADLAQAFGRDRRPLMLVEEIELRLRRAVGAVFSDEDIAARARPRTLEKMTLGAYPHVLDDEADWQRLGWSGVEHGRVLELIRRAADVRNALMHFSQDPLDADEVEALEGLLRIMRAVDRDPVVHRPLEDSPASATTASSTA